MGMFRLKAVNCLFALILIGCISLPLQANDSVDTSSSQLIPLPIATSEFAPFEFTENGKVIGSDSDIIATVLKRNGYEAHFMMMPWSRAIKQTETGKVAAIYSLTKNADRERYFIFSKPINYVKDVFFKMKYNRIGWEAYEDLTKYRVGVGQGYVYAKEFMKALDQKVFKSVNALSGENLEYRQLKQLKSEHIDLMICEISVCNYLISKHKKELRGIDYIDKPIGKIRPYFIGFSRAWPDGQSIADKFNKTLEQLKQSGEHEAILQRYQISTKSK